MSSVDKSGKTIVVTGVKTALIGACGGYPHGLVELHKNDIVFISTVIGTGVEGRIIGYTDDKLLIDISERHRGGTKEVAFTEIDTLEIRGQLR